MLTRILVLLLISNIAVGSLGNYVRADTQTTRLIHVGENFPDERLGVPEGNQDIDYLGLSTTNTSFTIREINADLVLVEILSIYCITCQMQAPFFNKLYDLIEADPMTRGRIKIIGIGVGNNQTQVDHFREEFNIPFPILPDPQMIIHHAVGGGRTPFTIFVRLGPAAQYGVVARTQLGAHEDYQQLFNDLRALMTLDLAAIQKRGGATEPEYVTVKPLMPESELRAKVKEVMEKVKRPISDFKKLKLQGISNVYAATVQREGEKEHLFAEVISRPPTCDVCHDVHFFYVFDEKGKILQFVPLQLTKYGNEPWQNKDVEKMRNRLLNESVFSPFTFDPEVDAISSATITSVIILDSMSRSKNLYQALKKEGLIK